MLHNETFNPIQNFLMNGSEMPCNKCSLNIGFHMTQEIQWTLHIVCLGWVQEIRVEFRICWWKWAVLMGVSAIVATERRTGWMMLPHMKEVLIRPTWGIATVLTYKDLRASLPVGIVLVNTVNLSHMGLQRATLCESFLTQLTFVGTDTCRREENKE